jgi:hypothetical protein
MIWGWVLKNEYRLLGSILERREYCRWANGLGISELDGKRCALKTERRIEFSQRESWWVQAHYRIFRKYYHCKRDRAVRPAGLKTGAASSLLQSRLVSVFGCAVTLWAIQCDACHTLEVDMYYLARSGVDIIEMGWNQSLEKRMQI